MGFEKIRFEEWLVKTVTQSIGTLEVMLESMGLSIMISWCRIGLHQGSVLSPISWHLPAKRFYHKTIIFQDTELPPNLFGEVP